MDTKEYVENVLKTESIDFEQIRQRMAIKEYIRLDHAADGLVTEAGEFKDILKKFKYYGKPVDVNHLVEELGDILWYAAIACDVLKFSMSDIMEINIEKLKARYGDKFSEERAINRFEEGEDEITGGYF